MSDKLVFKKEVFLCDCGAPEHQFIVTWDTDPMEHDMYVEVRLNNYLPWYKRIRAALGFIFKKGEANYDVVILNKDDQDRLAGVLKQKVDVDQN